MSFFCTVLVGTFGTAGATFGMFKFGIAPPLEAVPGDGDVPTPGDAVVPFGCVLPVPVFSRVPVGRLAGPPNGEAELRIP